MSSVLANVREEIPLSCSFGDSSCPVGFEWPEPLRLLLSLTYKYEQCQPNAEAGIMNQCDVPAKVIGLLYYSKVSS